MGVIFGIGVLENGSVRSEGKPARLVHDMVDTIRNRSCRARNDIEPLHFRLAANALDTQNAASKRQKHRLYHISLARLYFQSQRLAAFKRDGECAALIRGRT